MDGDKGQWRCGSAEIESGGKEANEGFEVPEKGGRRRRTGERNRPREIEEIRGEEHSSEHGLKPTCFRDLAYATNE